MTNKSATYKHDANKSSEPVLILRRNPWVNTKTVTMYALIGITLLSMVFVPADGQWADMIFVILVLLLLWLLGWWEVRAASIIVRGDSIESRTLSLFRSERFRTYNAKDITVIDAHDRGSYGLYGPTGKIGRLSDLNWSVAHMRTLAKAISVRVCDNRRNPNCPSRKS